MTSRMTSHKNTFFKSKLGSHIKLNQSQPISYFINPGQVQFLNFVTKAFELVLHFKSMLGWHSVLNGVRKIMLVNLAKLCCYIV